MKQIRVGVIGLGAMGDAHCRNVLALQETELTCLCDNHAEVAEEKGKEFGVKYFTDYKELVKSRLCDAIVVVVPHWFHPEVSICALENDIHVLSEKPLAVTVSDADKMLEAAKRRRKVLAVVHQMRTESFFKRAAEIVKGGILGEIMRTLCINPFYRTQAYYESNVWRATWKGEGGGVLINQSPHILDVFLTLGGIPCKIEAGTRTRLHDIEVEEEVQAFLEYKNGAWGYYYASTCEPVEKPYIEIVGDKGRLIIDDRNLTLQRYDVSVGEFTRKSDDMWATIPVKTENFSFKNEVAAGQKETLRNFIAAITEDEELIASGDDGLKVVEVINACILSGKKNKPVKLPVDREEYDELIEKLKKTSKPKKRIRIQRATDPKLAK